VTPDEANLKSLEDLELELETRKATDKCMPKFVACW